MRHIRLGRVIAAAMMEIRCQATASDASATLDGRHVEEVFYRTLSATRDWRHVSELYQRTVSVLCEKRHALEVKTTASATREVRHVTDKI